MLYKKPSFSVPATNGGGSCEKGHAMPDRRGKCIRCGERTTKAAQSEKRAAYEARTLAGGGYECRAVWPGNAS